MRKREPKNTSLASGEGKADRQFLTYLKDCYAQRDFQHAIHIHSNYKDGHGGGSSIDVAKEALQKCLERDYEAILLLLDSDIAKDDCKTLIQKAKQRFPKRERGKLPKKSKCIFATPCLEALLLKICTVSTPSSTATCKNAFKKRFGKEAHKLDDKDFATHFPKELLEERRACIEELDTLIRYFEIATRKDFSAYFS